MPGLFCYSVMFSSIVAGTSLIRSSDLIWIESVRVPMLNASSGKSRSFLS